MIAVRDVEHSVGRNRTRINGAAHIQFGENLQRLTLLHDHNVAVLIGSKSVTNKRPVGAIEAVNGTTLTGWAADPDRLGESLLIKVYVNGALALTTTADDPRDDLAGTAPLSAVPGYTSYGYSISLAGVSGLASGANQVDVFAVDLNNGKISPLGSRVITV